MERWKKVVGFPDYSVSDQGRVRRDVGGRSTRPGRILNGWQRVKCGYIGVQLQRDKSSFCHAVHRLVLEAFVGPCPEGMECCHNDGDPTNNRLENLRWDTRKSNSADKMKHGTVTLGERNGRSKLTEAQVRAIKFGNLPGLQREIAEKFGIEKSTVGSIRNGRIWAWLTEDGGAS